MKKIIFSALLALVSIFSFAQNVKLKITYKDYPVSQSDITIKLGDVTLGQGRTNDDGEVSINCSNLVSKSIDVYGKKETNNSTKTWDVKGYVNLDNNNFYHLKMEIMAKEMADASGGFMSENQIAAMWGMTAFGPNNGSNNNSSSNSNSNSGTNNSSNTNSSSGTGSNSSSSSDSEPDDEVDFNQMREENLAQYKTNLENDIIRFERKIKRDDKDIAEAKAEGKTATEIRRLEIDRQIDVLTKEKKEIQLKETNAKIAKTELPFDERKRCSARKDEIKAEIKKLKEEDKNLKKGEGSSSSSSSSNASSTSGNGTSNSSSDATTPKTDDKYSDAAIQNKSKLTLKKELIQLKADLKGNEISLKTKSSVMSQDKIEKLKKENLELEVLIAKYEKRIQELEAQKEKE